ncbi:MAG TPA: hypothetical protein VHG72_13865 [Polyangia bacterium]|nr:hypothetical protein [Polyangia bacterium]
MTRAQADRVVASLDVYLAAKRDWERRAEMGYDPAIVRKSLDVAREALVVALETIPTVP